MMINAWSPRDGSYALCSPAWYFDFFVTNGFADCKTYVCVSAGNRANVYWLDPAFMRTAEARIRVPLLACWWRIPAVLVLAEKAGEPSSPLVSPTQAHYRSEREWRRYLDNLAAIERSTRPHLARSIGHMLCGWCGACDRRLDQWPRRRLNATNRSLIRKRDSVPGSSPGDRHFGDHARSAGARRGANSARIHVRAGRSITA